MQSGLDSRRSTYIYYPDNFNILCVAYNNILYYIVFAHKFIILILVCIVYNTILDELCTNKYTICCSVEEQKPKACYIMSSHNI